MHIVDRSRGAGGLVHLLRRTPSVKQSWQLRWKPVCASTETDLSRWLQQYPLNNQRSISRAIISASQRFGRGQFSRTWTAPKGGVWLSAALPGDDLLKSQRLFGLAVAVALVEQIDKRGISIKIKWPNDLTFQNRKLAGLLPKLIYRGNTIRLARIGIGLNVANRVPIGAISLHQILGIGVFEPAVWSAEILIAIERSIELLSNQNKLCEKIDRRLWAKEITDPKTGSILQVKGIDCEGRLKLYKGSQQIIWDR